MSDPLEALLHYLHSHSFEQAKKKFPSSVISQVQDVGGLLNLELESSTRFRELVIITNGIPGGFKANPPFDPIPGTFIHPVKGAQGTFYISGPPPKGDSQFWLTQYPPSRGEAVGRTVIEFYTDDRITAILIMITMEELERVVSSLRSKGHENQGERYSCDRFSESTL